MSHQVPAGTYFDSIVLAAFLLRRISRMLETCLRYRATGYLVVNVQLMFYLSLNK